MSWVFFVFYLIKTWLSDENLLQNYIYHDLRAATLPKITFTTVKNDILIKKCIFVVEQPLSVIKLFPIFYNTHPCI